MSSNNNHIKFKLDSIQTKCKEISDILEELRKENIYDIDLLDVYKRNVNSINIEGLKEKLKDYSTGAQTFDKYSVKKGKDI